MGKIKPIYMSCEVQRRELSARLFFAVAAARRGYATVISQKLILKSNQAQLPQGIFWHKTATARCAHYYELSRQLGNRTVGCCEEILNMPNQSSIDDYAGLYFAPQAAENIDLYLSATALDTRIANGLPFRRILDIGNCRIELLRGRNRDVFAPYANYIRKTIGNYVLITSSFGVTASFRSEENERKEFASLRDPDDAPERDYFNERLEREKIGIDTVVSLSKALSAEGKTVVLRPHPHENPAMWRKLMASLPNVIVDERDTVAPWLMAAEAVLQGNCTTGLEAVLLDKPVGNYLDHADHTLSAQLIPPDGWPESLRQIARPQGGATLEAMKQSLYGIDEPIIANTLDAFDSLDPPECDLSDLLNVKFRSTARFPDPSMQHRWPLIDLKAARSFVKSSMRTQGVEGVWLGSPMPNIVIVAPSNAVDGTTATAA
jgi:surface carbohydrate biosynthesis protein